ncbi:unnamed protein product [Haemonchus placei]|uniref:ZP domain-containing protein n=1 Tax=Haemonchus placei TaxID=6290 RepID=A0A0N4VVX9_HAEPC|nr:unnamed protein product [Haemonchus placei]
MAEDVACIADDQSVIQLGLTIVLNGILHKCRIVSDSVKYEQEATCFDNGGHYSIGDTFRNGSFRLTCRRDGITIEGCYLQNPG